MRGHHILGYALATGLRLWLLMDGSLREGIASRVEVSTPVTSFTRIKEGAYLWQHGASPYSGDVLHQPPFVLFFFFPFVGDEQHILRALAWTSLQLMCAYALKHIAEEYVSSGESRPSCSVRGKFEKYKIEDGLSWTQDGVNDADKISERDREWMPHAVALTYLLHPFSILSCAGLSTIVLDHLLVSLAILTALRGLPVQANILLAIASHISPYFALSIPAVAIMLNKSRAGTSLVFSACFFTASISVIITASGIALGSFDFITNVYGFVATVPDMLPNVGLFWYFFMEIFDHFQSFFLFIFQFHMVVYPIPLSMRLSHRPTFLALCLLAISAVFKSYPSIGDTCLCFALAPLFHRQVAGASSIYYLAQVLLFVSVLAPLFWHLWIVTGTGNANFYYALTIAYAAAQVLMLTETMLAMFRYDRGVRRSAMRLLHRTEQANVDNTRK